MRPFEANGNVFAMNWTGKAPPSQSCKTVERAAQEISGDALHRDESFNCE
jgi:hypothetical protein